jgi:hypothetical protein
MDQILPLELIELILRYSLSDLIYDSQTQQKLWPIEKDGFTKGLSLRLVNSRRL